MKILFLITGLGMGGAEKVVTSLADELYKRGNSVKIIYFYGNPIVIPKCENVIVEKVDIKKIITFIFNLNSSVRLFNPDVIHANMFHANISSRIIKIFNYKTPVINTAHSSNEGGLFRTVCYRLSNFLCDSFTNVSNVAVRSFINKGIANEKRIQCIPNSISTETFKRDNDIRVSLREKLNISSKDRMLLTVGSFREPKDYPTLLNTAYLLSKDKIEFKWFVIGDGPERYAIELKIKKYELSEKVFLLGTINNVSDYMNASDFLVITSKWEGFGLSAAEAMACEKVVISTNCGGVVEVLGSNQFISPIADPEKLVDNIKSAFTLSEKEKNNLGNQGRHRINNEYSTEIVVNRWVSLYQSLISKVES